MYRIIFFVSLDNEIKKNKQVQMLKGPSKTSIDPQSQSKKGFFL